MSGTATLYKLRLVQSFKRISLMKFVLFGFLALAAISLAGGLAVAVVIGASPEVIGALLIALSVLVLATFLLSRLRGVLNLELDRRLPRALLTNDRR